MKIKVTSLPDAEPRDRHVAIGTFDGVHVGHRAVIKGADTVLTFDPHPVSVINPEAAPKLIMPFEVKRDVIEGLGVEELVVIPFDKEFSAIPAEQFIERGADRAARRRAGLGRRELPLRRQGQGRPRDARRARRVRDPGRAAGRGRRRDRLLDPDPRADRRRRRRGARCAASAPRSCSRARSSRATGAAASSASRPPTSSPTTTWSIPGHGVYAAFANGASGRGQRRRAADVRDRPRPADRGLPDRLRRRPLRPDAAGRLRRAPARRAALPERRGPDRADAPRRRGGARGLRRLLDAVASRC